MNNVRWTFDKILKNWILPTAAIVSLFFMIGFAQEYYAPKLESLITVNVEQLSREYTPLRVFPDKVKLSFFPPKLNLSQVRIIPQNELKASLAPLVIKNLQIKLSMLSLLRGALRIGELSVSDTEVSYIHKSTQTNVPIDTDLNELFNTVIGLPIDVVKLNNIDIFIQEQKSNVGLNISKLNLSIENSFQALLLDVDAPSVKFKKLNDEPIVDISLETKVLLRETRLQLSSFKVKKNESFIVASGSLYGEIPKLKFTDYTFRSRTHLQLDGLKKIADELGLKVKWPTLTGIINFDVSAEKEKGKAPLLNYELETDGFSIQPFEIGKIVSKGDVADDQIEIESLSLENRSGKVFVNDLKLKGDWLKLAETGSINAISFTGKVESQKIELRKLLVSLGVGDTPLHLLIAGKLDCGGVLLPTFNANCKGEARPHQFQVWSDLESGKKLTIAEFESAQLNGDFSVNDKRIDYKSDIKIANGVGKSSGVIDFAEGFKIDYEGNINELSKVTKAIANLAVEGDVTLKGNVSGNSKSAVFEIDLNSKNTWFENYGLGDITGKLNYKAGTLTVPKLDGTIGTNTYQASVAVNLLKEKIFFEGKSDKFEANDAIKAFSRKVTLPFTTTGLGKVKIKGEGPLAFNQLSYDFDLSINQGSIFNEPFDQFIFNVTANSGMVSSREIKLTRGRGVAQMTASANRSGIVSGQINGDRWALDGFETLKDMGFDVNGNLSFTSIVSDHILDPTVTFNGRIRDTTLNEVPMEESRINLATKKNSVNGEIQLFGGRLFTLFSIPFSEADQYNVFVRSKNFDYTRFFSSISSFATDKGFEGNLDGELRISARMNALNTMRGSLNITDLQLRRGGLALRNPKPMQLSVENGILKPEQFELIGEAGFLKLLKADNNNDTLNLELNGLIDLRILNLVLPFLEDLRGSLSLASKVSNQLQDFNVRGSAVLDNGYVKIKDFPHPIEKIKSNMTFANNKLKFDSITARFAFGNASADGSIDFSKPLITPVQIEGKFNSIQVDVPQGFKSEGDGDLWLTGDNFPYVFGLNYRVNKSSVKKDLNDGGSSTDAIRPSTYLPKNLNAETFVPFVFDLNVELQSPATVNVNVSNIEIQTTARGSLKIKGPLEDLKLTGRLTAGNQGQLAFRNNVLELNSGWLDYANASPAMPKVYFSANTRISNAYDINMLVQGIAKNPNIELSSSPALPEHEIISLLALGVTSKELDQNIQSEDQAAKTSIELGSALIRDQLGLNRNVENTFGVQVDISSSFDELSRESVPAVTIRKNFTPKFGLAGTRTLGDNQVNKLKAEMKLNKNLSVIGQFENQSTEGRQIQRDSEKVGLDFEYRYEFK